MKLFTIDNICNDQFIDSPRWGVVMAESVEDAIEQVKDHLKNCLLDGAVVLNRILVDVQPDSPVTCLFFYWHNEEGEEVGVDGYDITPIPGTVSTITEEELF